MRALVALLLAFACGIAAAQGAAVIRLRGSIESINLPQLSIRDRSGETVVAILPPDTVPAEVFPIEPAAIQPGAFIGTAAIPLPDGKLQALEVVVFPEAARGSGEGHHPWDLTPDSTMTNATVATLTRAGDNRTLTLQYKDGEKVVVVPKGVPVVTLRQGDRSLIVPGAKIFAVADALEDGSFVIRRLLVGRNGFEPPM